jgi:hypothetical protein
VEHHSSLYRIPPPWIASLGLRHRNPAADGNPDFSSDRDTFAYIDPYANGFPDSNYPADRDSSKVIGAWTAGIRV